MIREAQLRKKLAVSVAELLGRRYIRERCTTTASISVRSLTRLENFYQFIGYFAVKESPGFWKVRMWWLKNYDAGCPQEIREYRNGQPYEAVAPVDVLQKYFPEVQV